MTNEQTVFMVFFAIFWGTIANVQPRWKSFNYPLFGRALQPTLRIMLSVLILNILPIIYFSYLLQLLGNHEHLFQSAFDVNNSLYLALHGIIPAFGILGFYRLWMAIIGWFPKQFYFEKNCQLPVNFTIEENDQSPPEPTMESLSFKPDTLGSLLNFIFGLFYIIAGILLSEICFC